jgi:serine protease AprX
MATALVSGGVALILEKWPFLKPEQVKLLLMKKAQNVGLGSELQGAGVLDVGRIFKGVRKSGKINPKSTGIVESPLMSTIMQLFTDPHNQPEANNLAMKTILSLLNNFTSQK